MDKISLDAQLAQYQVLRASPLGDSGVTPWGL